MINVKLYNKVIKNSGLTDSIYINMDRWIRIIYDKWIYDMINIVKH